MITEVKDIDGAILDSDKFSEKVINAAPKLKVISAHGVGTDNIDIKAATRKGILVTHTPGVMAGAVYPSLHKEDITSRSLFENGKMGEKEILSRAYRDELWKKTLGIIGLGNIGSQVAKIGRTAFDMKVLAYDPYVPDEKAGEVGAQMVDLKILLEKSDYISINCPLTNETRGMIGEKELRLMKNTATLVNTARGGIVKEDALYRALKEGWIAGAGIDVLENEPVSEHPLFNLDNVLLTPHSAAWTTDALKRVAIVTCENILKVLKGQIPENIVNTEVISHVRASKKEQFDAGEVKYQKMF